MANYRVGIIGGGAAGLFAGCFLKKAGVDFCVLEAGNEVGRKLLLTGHGRCNITNRKAASELKSGYHEAGNFVYPALKKFSPEDAVAFVQDELGVPLKEEDNNRMFPVSDKASDIRDALVRYIGAENIIFNFKCVDLTKDGDAFEATSSDGREFSFEQVIVACGGKSFPKTGSDGSGYELATRMGHNVTPLVPALVSVDVCEKDREFTSSLSGVSVNAGASLYYDNKKQTQETGDVLFTHRGVSGPAIMKMSRNIPRDIVSRDGWIELDFTPGRNEQDVDEELLREMDIHADTKLTTLASKFVPSSVANQLGKRAGVTDLYAAKVTREQRKAYLKEIKHLELHIDNPPRYEEAYVTRGGVALKELKRETMESKIVPGLWFIGEVIDVDGISGGYNLQACMSEAFIAVANLIQ
ncbi:MAG: aminoacetone oxidase family FAD-binding enzyme [Saccharofermentans sp.]|nr:aminoacetone oxidase family FAD-binding enzyme [Saccharofermentans sp.]